MQNRPTDASELKRQPRYATKRNPALRTRGGKIGILAKEIGRPLLPHQQYIADVATELNPPGSRLTYRYQFVVISLPRQTGKTTLLRPVVLERSLTTDRMQCLITAQKGKDATARWSDLVEDLRTSEVFESFLHLLRSKGSEQCIFPNASLIAPFTPDKEGLHGYSPPFVAIDEGWAFSETQGADLLRAIRPSQITKTDRQLWIISAAGDATSVWWDKLVENGRNSVNDPNSKMAYFEWSADPDLDPYDPATWEFHPGLDGLIDIDDLAEESKPDNNSHTDFLRGFLNRSTAHAENLVIPLDKWEDKTRSFEEPIKMSDCHLAYDVAIDGSAATIYAAYAQDGVKNLVLVKTGEGTGWITEYLDALMRENPPASLSADDGGHARVITDELTRKGHTVHALSGRDMSTAWIAFKDAAKAPGRALMHDDTGILTTQIKVAVESQHGDTTTLSRRRSLGATDALRAAAIALWQADHAKSDVGVW